jgi:hypothetical protein
VRICGTSFDGRINAIARLMVGEERASSALRLIEILASETFGQSRTRPECVTTDVRGERSHIRMYAL